jgi:hypothetical protein
VVTYSYIDEVLLVRLRVDPGVDHVSDFWLESCDLLLGELYGLVVSRALPSVAVLTVKPQLVLTP